MHESIMRHAVRVIGARPAVRSVGDALVKMNEGWFVSDLSRDLEQIFESHRKGDLSERDVDFCIVRLMTPANVDEVVAAIPDELRASFTELANPSFGEHPFVTSNGVFEVPPAAIRAAREWAERNER